MPSYAGTVVSIKRGASNTSIHIPYEALKLMVSSVPGGEVWLNVKVKGRGVLEMWVSGSPDERASFSAKKTRSTYFYVPRIQAEAYGLKTGFYKARIVEEGDYIKLIVKVE